MTPKIDVCVATYKRPQLLKKLLLSLAAQETGGEYTFAVVVADNDVERSAEPVVRELNASGAKIIYAVEPEQNISLARNKALSLATGDYIAAIDDDEYANSSWLLQLYRALTSFNADVVHGPVIPEFPPQTPRYIREAFMRPNPPTGSTGKYILNAGNTLFRRTLIEGTKTPFDPRFGRTGAEDTAFFFDLRRRGSRMTWCREALVFEAVPSPRANLMWLVRRKFRHGNLYPRYHGYSNPMRVAQFCFTCLQLPWLACLALFFLVGGMVSAKSYRKAIECVLDMPFRLGVLAYYINVRVGNSV
ncbi:MAG TPA: glycosyltransferase family 2 protein [Chthoniobacterales bacterium]|jgi:succinoglycan biosynthesis protein ExoM